MVWDTSVLIFWLPSCPKVLFLYLSPWQKQTKTSKNKQKQAKTSKNSGGAGAPSMHLPFSLTFSEEVQGLSEASLWIFGSSIYWYIQLPKTRLGCWKMLFLHLRIRRLKSEKLRFCGSLMGSSEDFEMDLIEHHLLYLLV